MQNSASLLPANPRAKAFRFPVYIRGLLVANYFTWSGTNADIFEEWGKEESRDFQ